MLNPTVIRYLPEAYVDAFFKDGLLRLPTFRCFRMNPDEAQGDFLEGRVTAELQTAHARHSIQAWNGQAAFVLCGTLIESAEMEAAFRTQRKIRIRDIERFAHLVSKHVPGFISAMHGNCVYRDDVTIRKSISVDFPLPPPSENMEGFGLRYDQFVAAQMLEGYFIKRAQYSRQNEYRLIWFAEGTEPEEALFIRCPEATKVCERG